MKEQLKILALSVKQPFADQIATGQKRVEYRTWLTHHRGDLLIVSTKKPEVGSLPLGCAVALVSVVDCVESEEGDWEWILENPRPIKPFPVRGNTGLYRVLIPSGALAVKQPKE